MLHEEQRESHMFVFDVLSRRKLDRKPSELFDLPCVHHLQAGHHSFL